MLLGGNSHSKKITTYDWTTGIYVDRAVLQFERKNSTCALLTTSDGQKLVVVAGGEAGGTEAYNPLDVSVITLSADFPPGYNFGGPTMVAENGGSDLIFYSSESTQVWKYSSATSSWTQIGNLISYRADTVVLAVSGLSCDF